MKDKKQRINEKKGTPSKSVDKTALLTQFCPF